MSLLPLVSSMDMIEREAHSCFDSGAHCIAGVTVFREACHHRQAVNDFAAYIAPLSHFSQESRIVHMLNYDAIKRLKVMVTLHNQVDVTRSKIPSARWNVCPASDIQIPNFRFSLARSCFPPLLSYVIHLIYFLTGPLTPAPMTLGNS